MFSENCFFRKMIYFKIVLHIMCIFSTNFNPTFQEFFRWRNFRCWLQQNNNICTVWDIDKHKGSKQDHGKNPTSKTLRLCWCSYKIIHPFALCLTNYLSHKLYITSICTYLVDRLPLKLSRKRHWLCNDLVLLSKRDNKLKLARFFRCY